jgi:phenylalanyl-tRNA synthetase alpha subunit
MPQYEIFIALVIYEFHRIDALEFPETHHMRVDQQTTVVQHRKYFLPDARPPML